MADTHVTITGNLTDDPELTYTTGGTAVANFRLAVTPRVRDGNGWKDGDTSFFRITAWRDLAEHLVPELAPGRPEVVPVGVRG
jgi:single-strand DNA-binding protein